MQHIIIRTKFNIQPLKLPRVSKFTKFPIKSDNLVIENLETWEYLKKIRSNWETVVQVVSLRTQPLNIRVTEQRGEWVFEFECEHDDVYRLGNDSVGLLKSDFNFTPMNIGLGEVFNLAPVVVIDENTFISIQ